MTNWTPERIEELEILWETGMPTKQIAKKMGTTKNAIIGKANRLGLSRRPSPIPKTGRKPIVKPDLKVVEVVETKDMIDHPPKKLRALIELRNGECRYPYGDPKKEGFGFCAEPTKKTYCDKHKKITTTIRDKRLTQGMNKQRH